MLLSVIITTFNEKLTILEIIKRVEDLTSTKITYDVVKKREGDSGTVVASSKIAFEELGWEQHFSKLDIILDSMWNIYKGF